MTQAFHRFRFFWGGRLTGFCELLRHGETVDGPVEVAGPFTTGFFGSSCLSATPQRLDAMK